MTGTTCLEAATEAWLRPRVPGDRQAQLDDLAALAAYGVFSNRNLEEITGLPENVIAGFTQKRDHTGGRLVGHTLPLLLRFERDLVAGRRNLPLLHKVLEEGTSRRTVVKLTSVTQKTMELMTR